MALATSREPVRLRKFMEWSFANAKRNGILNFRVVKIQDTPSRVNLLKTCFKVFFNLLKFTPDDSSKHPPANLG